MGHLLPLFCSTWQARIWLSPATRFISAKHSISTMHNPLLISPGRRLPPLDIQMDVSPPMVGLLEHIFMGSSTKTIFVIPSSLPSAPSMVYPLLPVTSAGKQSERCPLNVLQMK